MPQYASYSGYGGSGGGGGGGTPGGTSGQVQYNNAGSFGGFGNWNGTTLAITGAISSTTTVAVGTNLHVFGTSIMSGDMVVQGGANFSGNLGFYGGGEVAQPTGDVLAGLAALNLIATPTLSGADITLGTVAIANGGTGQATANAALNALLPNQATHAGEVLTTDGTNTSWMATGGTGTVTSVDFADGSTTPIFAISGNPVTASGTITETLVVQAANKVFAGPTTGASAQPTFRSLVVADIPALPYASSTLTNTHIFVGNGSNVATDVALSGDATLANTGALTLATVNGNVGTFGSSTSIPTFTVNAKGLLTAASGNVVIAPAGTLTGTTLASNVVTSSLTSLGTQSVALNMGSHLINAVTDPVSAQDAATKNYVDTVASGLQPIQGVSAASVANVVGTYNNGAGGIGATFTTTSTATFVLDGYTPTLNQRVLLKDQTSSFQNGVYNVTQLATGILPAILTRALDYNTASDMDAGNLIPVINGTVNNETSWLQTSTVTTVGTDPLVFVLWTANPFNYLLKSNNLSDVSSLSTSFNNISPITTTGDIIYSSSGATNTRLPIGTSGQVLTVSSGVPAWSAASAGTVTSVAMTVPSFLSVAGSPVTTSGTLAVTLSGTALPVANGGTGDTSFTANQVILGGTTSTGALTQVTGGTAGYILTSNGTTAAPSFQPAPGTVSAFYASSQVNTSSGSITGNTFTTFDNSPAFTFTPSITGTYKVYASIPVIESTGAIQAFIRIIDTLGSPTILEESYATIFPTIAANAFCQNVYTLTAGTPYTFDIQGRNSSTGDISINATATQFYMFAELLATGSLPLQVSDINGLSGALTLSAGTGLTLNTTGNALTIDLDTPVSIANGGTNNGSLPVTAGGVLYTDGTLVDNVGAGTAGYVLTSNGASPPTWNPAGGGGGSFQFFQSSVINTSSASNGATTFTQFSNSPGFTFTPTVSGTYKVYLSATFYQGNALTQSYMRVVNTVGGATLLAEQIGSIFCSTAIIASTCYLQSVYTLVAATPYTFEIEGKSSSGGVDLELFCAGAASYMFAELCG